MVTSTVGYQLTAAERKTYERYARLALPRHTSYPIASAWTTDYGPGDLREDLGHSARQGRPLSLYVHIPYCERLCYYCACTKEIVPEGKRRDLDPSAGLLAGLEREADRFAEVVGDNPVRQVHLGGGTPTFLRPEDLRRLWKILRDRFAIEPDAEVALEVDPRVTTHEHLVVLRELAFSRLSLGIQDFDPTVQRAVNRVQPYHMVERFVAECRALGFSSINFDLLYGLPFQTLPSIADTLEKTIQLAPDRIAFYRLAVIPEIFRVQNVFRHTDMPSGDLPLELNLLAINRFRAAGYEFIGLDHFAKPGEELSRASDDGTLRRTFQGMTTGKGLDVLGLGPSAISQLDDAFAQNQKTSSAWATAADRDFATERGLRLGEDDRVRRELLQQLYCYGTIDKPALEREFRIIFDDYFAVELRRLRDLADEGLVTADAATIRVTEPLGRLLVRVVAAVFDRYLGEIAFREGLPVHQASRVG